MTNCERYRRGFTASELCPICHQSAETPLHLLRDCEIAQAIWRDLSADVFPEFFQQGNFEEWLLQNLKTHRWGEVGRWDMVFALTLDRLWWARNELVFKQTIPSSVRTVARVKKLVSDIQCSNRILNILDGTDRLKQGGSEISWIPPPPTAGWVKLNCDGGSEILC